MRRPYRCLAPAALLYGAIALAANLALAFTPAERAELKGLATGEMAKLVLLEEPQPRLEAPFRDRAGNRVTLADYAGKVVLLNFWATWCPPCRAEMPALDRLAGAMAGPEFEVIALSTDRGGIERVEKFFRETGVAHLEPTQDPAGELSREAGVMGLPVTLILDREGREIARMIGAAEWDSPQAQAVIRRVIEMTRPGAGATRT